MHAPGLEHDDLLYRRESETTWRGKELWVAKLLAFILMIPRGVILFFLEVLVPFETRHLACVHYFVICHSCTLKSLSI
jgi:hypothetical protein